MEITNIWKRLQHQHCICRLYWYKNHRMPKPPFELNIMLTIKLSKKQKFYVFFQFWWPLKWLIKTIMYSDVLLLWLKLTQFHSLGGCHNKRHNGHQKHFVLSACLDILLFSRQKISNYWRGSFQIRIIWN